MNQVAPIDEDVGDNFKNLNGQLREVGDKLCFLNTKKEVGDKKRSR